MPALQGNVDTQGEIVNNAEKDFQDQVRQLGCICCRIDLNTFSPCDIHHILNGGRRIGEMDVLGLCQRHHRSGAENKVWVSRHPWRKKFVERYGSEESLLKKTRELVKEDA